ncbi:MAG: DNA primase [Pirellulaceae bacterium]
MSFAYDDKDRVKQATDIVDLTSSYLQLRRQGSNYVATCPWHDDQRPSLQINPARQSWKCWVCDIGGDVFSFIMKRENVEFRHALEMLAERAGIDLTSRPRARTVAGNPNDKPTLFKAMQWAATKYHRCLHDDPAAEPARRYLAARGIHENALKQFQIGFAPNSWSWLLEHCRSAGFSPEVLQACGLVGRSDRTSGWYERFRGRLMFPIQDTQDRPIAFGGRVLPEIAEHEETETGRPPAKYINSPETRLYAKSDNLYGLNIARKALSSDRHLIIVEGYTDVIGTWIAGIENVSAVCGTSLNQRHIHVIRRFADRITLVLDGDEAGQRRTNEILEHFVRANVDLRIMTLPEGQDPCDYVQQHGAGQFRQLIDDANDALDHKIAIETRGIDLIRDTHRANQALNNILGTISSSPTSLGSGSENRLREQQILTRLSLLFQIDLPALTERMAELRKRQRHTRVDGGTSASSKPKTLRALERELLQVILRDTTLVDRAVENISPDQFVEGVCRDIYEMICACYHEGETISFESLMLQLEDPELKHMLNELDEESQSKSATTETGLSDQLNQIIMAFDRRSEELERKESIAILNQPETNEQEESKILERLFQQAKERQGNQ